MQAAPKFADRDPPPLMAKPTKNPSRSKGAGFPGKLGDTQVFWVVGASGASWKALTPENISARV